MPEVILIFIIHFYAELSRFHLPVSWLIKSQHQAGHIKTAKIAKHLLPRLFLNKVSAESTRYSPTVLQDRAI